MPGRRMDWVHKSDKIRSDLVLKSSLPAWIIRALRESGIKRLSRIATMSDHDLLMIPGIGRRSLALIRAELASREVPHAKSQNADNRTQQEEAGSGRSH